MKLDMTLDEIIAREPRRYTGTGVEPPDSNNVGLKMNRPRLYGRVQAQPYQRAGQPNNERVRNGWSHYTRTPVQVTNKKCPYNFKYNGVFVTDNSPLLNRTLGEVEAIRKDEDGEESPEEEVEEVPLEDGEGQLALVSSSTQRPTPQNPQPQPRFKDMTYVRLPVHQRLGINPNQFLTSRVNYAAKLLRSRRNQSQIKKWKANDRHGFLMRRPNILNNTRLKMSSYQRETQEMVNKSKEMQVHFQNDLANTAAPVMMQKSILQANNDAVFVAPLSRQNVEQLSGRFVSSAASSHITSISRSNEDILNERLTSVENMLFQGRAAASGMSLGNGYIPLSHQLAVNNTMGVQSDGVPMGNVGGSTVSMVNGIPMALVRSMPVQQQPVTMVVGNEIQTFVPLNAGPSTSGQYVVAQQPSQQGRIVLCQQDGGIIVQSVPTMQSTSSSGRLGRQLLIAANRQPLDTGIQTNISASQTSYHVSNSNVNTNNRLPRESFEYQPTPHATQSSINTRITQLPPQQKPAGHGRRFK